MNRPFDNEDRLKELIVKQAELSKLLDLDKSDVQTVGEAQDQPKEVAQPAPVPFDGDGLVPFSPGKTPARDLANVLGASPARALNMEPV